MIGIGYPNLVTSSTGVSGGSWLAGLPVTNVRTSDLSRVARSTDDSAASTTFTYDHGSAVSARAVVLLGTNASATATVQLERGTTSGASDVADSGAVSAWPITPTVRSGRAHNVIVILPSTTSARYDTVSIVDESNPDGYVDIGQAFVCDLTVPTHNVAYGLQYGLQPMGTAERSPSGTLWANAQRTLRTVSMVLEYSPLTEADAWHEMLRCASITEQVLFVPSLTNRAEQQRYGFVGTYAELSAIEYPYIDARKIPLRLTEFA